MADSRVIITAQADQAIQEFNRLRSSATGSLQQIGQGAGQFDRVTQSAAQTRAALRQVPAQLTDIVVSLQSGQAPLTVFLQQGGQLRDMFGSAGAAAKALGGYVVSLINPFTVAAGAGLVLALAYNQGSHEADLYTKALVMNGNAVATTTGQMADMARHISATVGTQGAAAEAVAEIASTSQVAAHNLEEFGQEAVLAQKYIGKSVQDTAKDFAELGKAPVDASRKLNDQYHYLTFATFAQIKALDEQGRHEEALELAQRTYSQSMTERANKLKANLGPIEGAWKGVGDWAKKAWDNMLNIGREDTLEQKLAKVAERIKKTEQARYSFVNGKDANERLPALRAEQEALQAQQREQTRANEAKEKAQKLDEAKYRWDDLADQHKSKKDKLAEDITRATNTGAAAGIKPEEIKKVVDQIKAEYGDLNNVGIAALEAQRNVDRELLAGSLASLESRHKRMLITDEQYYQQKRDLELKDLDAESASIKKQANLAAGKSDLAEREKYLGALQVLQQRRKNIIQAADDEIAASADAVRRAVREQINTWSAATTNEQAQLQEETALFGQSAEARKIASAQLKVDADLRQFLASQQKQGHTLTDQEIADLRAAAKARKDNIAAIMGEQQAREGAEQLRQANARFAAESIIDDRARSKALLEVEADTWRERIKLAGEGTEAQKLLQTQFDTWYANQSARPQIEAQKQLWQSLEQTAHQTFISIADGGKSAATRLKDSLKNILFDWLYQMTLKQWIINVGATLGTSGSGAGAAGGSSGGGVLDWVSAGKKLYDGITTGFASVGASLGGIVSGLGNLVGSSSISAFGTGMGMTSAQAANAAAAYNGAGMTGVGSSLSTGSAVGSVAGAAAGVAAGVYGGRALSGGYAAFGGSGNGAVNAGTAIGATVGSIVPVIGTALGAVVGGLLGGAVNRLFGHKAKEVTSEGITGTFDGNGFSSGQQYANWVQKGGIFRSDKHGTDITPVSAELQKALGDGFAAVKTTTQEFAKTLGVSADVVNGYSKSLNLELTKDSAKNDELIGKLFSDIGDELAARIVPSIATFSKEGETASATLQRLAGDFQTVDAMLVTLGRTSEQAFGVVGVASLQARERLIALAGGTDALASQTQYFADTFLSKAEQIAPVQKMVAEKLGELGQQGLKTKDDFKQAVLGLVNSGQLATEKGAATYAALLALAPAFAAVAEYAQDAGDSVAQAAEKFAAAKSVADSLFNAADGAFATLQNVINRERSAISAEHDVRMKGIQQRIDAENATIAKLRGLSDSLHAALGQVEVTADSLESRSAAQAKIQAALAIARVGGPLPTADSLKGALGVVTRDAASQFATYNDYLRDRARTANDIGELANLTDQGISVEERTLDVLEKQKDQEQLQFESEMKKLDEQLAAAQEQVDLLKGNNAALLSLTQALAAFGSALQAAQANPIAGSTAPITQAYQTYLGRNPEADGLAWWQQQAANGVPISSIVNGIKNSNEAKIQNLYGSILGRGADADGLQFYMNAISSGASIDQVRGWLQNSDEYKNKVPAFATGGDHVGGARLVGEFGPELEVTGPSRIFNAQQTASMLRGGSNEDLVQELQELRKETVELRKMTESHLYAIAKSTRQTADLQDTWEVVGQPKVRAE
jgi:phage-related minor tail protein